jgi:hypothetical protein
MQHWQRGNRQHADVPLAPQWYLTVASVLNHPCSRGTTVHAFSLFYFRRLSGDDWEGQAVGALPVTGRAY